MSIGPHAVDLGADPFDAVPVLAVRERDDVTIDLEADVPSAGLGEDHAAARGAFPVGCQLEGQTAVGRCGHPGDRSRSAHAVATRGPACHAAATSPHFVNTLTTHGAPPPQHGQEAMRSGGIAHALAAGCGQEA